MVSALGSKKALNKQLRNLHYNEKSGTKVNRFRITDAEFKLFKSQFIPANVDLTVTSNK